MNIRNAGVFGATRGELSMGMTHDFEVRSKKARRCAHRPGNLWHRARHNDAILKTFYLFITVGRHGPGERRGNCADHFAIDL